VKTISFAGEGVGAELMPLEEIADCAATALAKDGRRILSYGPGAGYTPLRELVAEWFAVHPYRVFLTNGWLQGFSLIARDRVAGRNVVVEYPTAARPLRALFASGATVIYADLGDEGLNLDDLQSRLQQTTGRPALAYTMPTFQNPTGRTLSPKQRTRLIGLVGWGETVLVEDDSYAALRLEGEPAPTLFELSGQRTVYSTSFSHTIAPGLRVGVFILPDELAGELSAKANSTYIAPVLLGQATVFEFIRRGAFEPHLESLCEALRLRRDAMLAALARHVPHATWRAPEGGFFVLVELPSGTNAALLLERAEGVTAPSGDDFGGRPSHIRLNYGAASPEEIELGIERLGAALATAH
jgi:2-aminoadipate transaminase